MYKKCIFFLPECNCSLPVIYFGYLQYIIGVFFFFLSPLYEGHSTDILVGGSEIPVQRSQQKRHPRDPRPRGSVGEILGSSGLHGTDKGANGARDSANLVLSDAKLQVGDGPVLCPPRDGRHGDRPSGLSGPLQPSSLAVQGHKALRRLFARPSLRARAPRYRPRHHSLDGDQALLPLGMITKQTYI